MKIGGFTTMKKHNFFKRFFCFLMVCVMLCGVSVTAMAAEVQKESESVVEATESRALVINAWGEARYNVSRLVTIPAGSYTFYYSVTTPGNFYFNYGNGFEVKTYELSGSGQYSVTLPKPVIEWVFVPNSTSNVYSYSFTM